MSNVLLYRFSPVKGLLGLVIVFALTYIALIAIVMSYAAVTVEFTQSVRTDEAAVSQLESSYLNQVAQVTRADYVAKGYGKPVAQIFVAGASATAFNIR